MTPDRAQQLDALAFFQDAAESQQRMLMYGGYAGAAIALVSLSTLAADGVPGWVSLVGAVAGALLCAICFPIAKLAGKSPVLAHLANSGDVVMHARIWREVVNARSYVYFKLTTASGQHFTEYMDITGMVRSEDGKAAAAIDAIQRTVPQVDVQ